MDNNKFLSIGVYQGPISQGNMRDNLDKTNEQMARAESKGLDILCMPESYLHGYFESKEQAMAHSIDFNSQEYKRFLNNFRSFSKTTLLMGLNERCGGDICNTVVVIENGKHVGQYRKAYTYAPYDYFSLGREFPIFSKKGINYGILICIDSAYQEPAHILALKGAQLLFCPMFNRVERDARMLNYLNRKSHLISRAFENECWFASSDIILEDDEKHVCPGSATILDNNGEVVSRSQPFSEMILQYDIPIHLFRNNTWDKSHFRRLIGNSELREIANNQYSVHSGKNKCL